MFSAISAALRQQQSVAAEKVERSADSILRRAEEMRREHQVGTEQRVVCKR